MKRPLPRLFGFLLAFLLFLGFADTFLIRTDLFTRAMLYELREASDIEIAFVGSSVCRNHVNAGLLSERLGKRVFNASVPDLAMQGSIALMKELFLRAKPETVVLVVDVYTFDSDLEAPEAEYMMMPWLSRWQNRLSYYRDLTKSDGWYLDRLLLFREFGVKSPADILKTAALRLFPHEALQIYGNTAVDRGIPVIYEGSGFLRYETEKRADEDIRARMQRIYTGWDYRLSKRSQEMLLSCRDLAKGEGSRLLVLVSPSHTVHQLADPSYSGYTLRLMQFCRKNGIECINFGWARPQLMPNLDAYYYDLFHLSGDGADLYSEALSVYLGKWLAGEDTSSLFYGSQGEYLQQYAGITNVWIEKYDRSAAWNRAREQEEDAIRSLPEGEDVYLANCNHGPGVSPRYRFVLREANGSEKPLTPWQQEGVCRLKPGALAGNTLRVYASPAEGESNPVWYDYTE